MSNGANKNYDNGRKNNWRRWEWNRIVDFLVTPPREAVVLYLAGKDDLDRQIALSRGFRNDNLIAVDRDARIVNSLRASGSLAIKGDIFSAAIEWPLDKQVNVVIPDLCSGWDLKTHTGLVACMIITAPEVVSLNFLRGRDKQVSHAKSCFPVEEKHRGFLAYGAAVSALAREIGKKQECGFDFVKNALIDLSSLAENSYKSGSQVFDSVVFRNPLAFLSIEKIGGFPGFKEKLGAWRSELRSRLKPLNRQSVAAVAAHHTMRNS